VSIYVEAPERKAYEQALSAHDVTGPLIIIGRRGMCENMQAVYSHYPNHTHLIIMIDTVTDISFKKSKAARVVSMPEGMFVAFANHAYDMMWEHGAFMWGLNNGRAYLGHNAVSLKFGLVTQAVVGHYVMASRRSLFDHKYGGVVWDIEHSVNTWRKDGVLLRYTMCAACHCFGKPGGFGLDPKERKRMENAALKDMERDHGDLITFKLKTPLAQAHTRKVQNYQVHPVGPPPVLISTKRSESSICQDRPGAPAKYSFVRKLSWAERKRAQRAKGSLKRKRLAILTASKVGAPKGNQNAKKQRRK